MGAGFPEQVAELVGVGDLLTRIVAA